MMNKLRQCVLWLKSPKSDLFLFVVVLILVNLVGSQAFVRLDLTGQHSYSLSAASRRVVKTIPEPLAVKVFFSEGLPAPYNSVERYLKDLLVEYRGVGNRNFSYDFFDMEKAENKDIAQSYGITPIQVQELKNDEVGMKNAFMGLAIVYSDSVERINGITKADGLEYSLTTTMGRLMTTASSLATLSGKVKVSLYASSNLAAFKINGWDQLDKAVRESYGRVNEKNHQKLDYQFIDGAEPSALEAAAKQYGLQKITWAKQSNGIEAGFGLLGLVIEYQDKVRTIPLSLQRGIFGGYQIGGLAGLDQNLAQNLEALLSNTLQVGYLSGHGEKSLKDDRQGATRLESLVSDLYQFKEIDLSKEEIPANLTTVVVNGPRAKLSDAELYKLDQFLLRGGNLFLLVDSFDEVQGQGGGMYGSQPSYLPIDTGIDRLLDAYGVKVGKNYVLDSECYVARQQGQGETPLNWVPIVAKEGLDQRQAVSRHLANVLFLKASALEVTPSTAHTATVLAKSSPESWLMEGRISLMPYMISKPAADKLAPHNLAVLLEGRFSSAFDAAPPALAGLAAPDAGASKTSVPAVPSGGASLTASAHLSSSVQNGKIILVGTSEIAGNTLLDPNGQEPVAIFTRNALDYLSGNQELNDMRPKGLALDPLDKTAPMLRAVAKSFNIYGLPVLVALSGLLAWRLRIRRRAKIQARYVLETANAVEEKK